MRISELLLKLSRIPARINWMLVASTLRSKGAAFTAGIGFQVVGGKYISVGSHFSAGRNVSIQAWERGESKSEPQLLIGDNVVMADNSFISCSNKVIVGDGTLLGVNAFITDNSHGCNSLSELHIPPAERKLYSKGPVIIGTNVWIGRNVCIMPGVCVGDGAVIGANAVVTHDIPDYSVAAGVPARIIKHIM